MTQSNHRTAALAGLLALLCYFGAAFLPLPDSLARLLAFAFGPLLIVGFFGIHDALVPDRDGLLLRAGVVFGIVAGAIVTTMLTVQQGNFMYQAEGIAAAASAEEEELVRLVGRAVNRVQSLMDVSWDIFISGATALIGAAMIRSRAFGRIWGWTGIVAGLLLLSLNLLSFPRGPAYAGSVDAGPLVALWYGAVYVRLVLMRDGASAV